MQFRKYLPDVMIKAILPKKLFRKYNSKDNYLASDKVRFRYDYLGIYHEYACSCNFN